MARTPTAKQTNSVLLQGNKLYQQRARLTLPYLVRQAKAGKPIYYSVLAEELGMPNARNLNYPLGTIGNALSTLSKQLAASIPPIQCVVVNKTTNLPGEGIGWFITKKDYSQLSKVEKKRIVDLALVEIYNYPHWDWVLEELALAPVPALTEEDLTGAGTMGGGGESESHRKFKEFIALNPHVVGLDGLNDGKMEVILPSADKLDVLFLDGKVKIGIEVKSILSGRLDIIRGMFQCVKYKHLIEAEQKVKNEYPKSRVILALQGPLPPDLLSVKNVLGVEVVDNIEIIQPLNHS
ncbi:MAG: hypothetical protein EOO88_44425 [Pedobacter sp.]|nr:MAG: hypothetical protein EOO88_44425 [Pedobacter sp.]